MIKTSSFGAFYERIIFELFYINSWFECFCQMLAENDVYRCFFENNMEILYSRLELSEGFSDLFVA